MRPIDQHASWPDCSTFQHHINAFQPFVARHVSGIEGVPAIHQFQSCDAAVDISCLSDGGVDFSGNPTVREQVQLKMSDFVGAFQSLLLGGEQHWVLAAGLQLFLSQCCLYSSDGSGQQIECPQAYANRPALLLGEEVDSINLWANLQAAQSALHYDANHNLLVQVQGTKRVFLISPALSSLLAPVSAFAESHNHSQLSCAQVEQLLQQQVLQAQGDCFVVDLDQGDALFIPEGWWHMVRSAPCSAAVNYWFRSPAAKLLAQAAHMASYLVRQSVHAVAMHEAQRAHATAADDDESAYAQLISADVQQLQDIWVIHAQQHPEDRTTFLLGIGARDAYRLLGRWDQLTSSTGEDVGGVFTDLFQPCGDTVSQVRATLINQRNAFIADAGRDLLHRILGT